MRKKINQENLVPVDMKVNIEGMIIKDQFLWEASVKDTDIMRVFGLQLLSERLGRTAFTQLPNDSKRRFATFVSEIISYNINLYNRLSMSEIIGSIKAEKKHKEVSQDKEDPSSEANSCPVHPIVKINIRVHKDDGELIEDSLFWDLT